MRLLLDTHALIWYVDQDHLLSTSAHAAITDPANDLLLSAGTIWEIGIKVGLSKLSLSMPYREWMNKAIADLGLTLLPISVEYADVQAGLPRHHGDPFDRLLAAQARVENIPLVSSDPIFDRYGLKRIWNAVP
ncbi:MAG: type II toxin-antitoxin system VapC family toxin [Pirellulales bacterium]|nr:type II toxin-antitoxin system VapC family toxin [Pirellulales bacterium]